MVYFIKFLTYRIMVVTFLLVCVVLFLYDITNLIVIFDSCIETFPVINYLCYLNRMKHQMQFSTFLLDLVSILSI